jgi:prepilin-type N-terminal cleavage/methylation domain-containing protein
MANKRSGFSLMESIIVIALVGGLVLVVASLRANLSTLDQIVSQRLQSRGDVDQAIQIMSTEIRSAGPSSLGAYPIEKADRGEFIFYSDIDKDGLFERVRYFISTSTIKKGITKPSGNPLTYTTSTETQNTAVASVVGVSSTIFSYYNSDYTGTSTALSYPANPTAVKVIEYYFYADVNASTSPTPEFFSGAITSRNLRIQ